MGVIGLGLASSITNFIKLAFTFIYSYCSPDINKAMVKPGREAFEGWIEYLKLAFPVLIIVCSEWWAYEAITILAGLLGTKE